MPRVSRCLHAVPLGAHRLFTPGPLTTSAAVKEAARFDVGSRDATFLKVCGSIRDRLLSVAGVSKERGYECVLLPGSGSYSLEAMLGSVIPRKGGKAMILCNGAYGERQTHICNHAQIPFVKLDHPWNRAYPAQRVAEALEAHPDVTHLSFVHHETTAGVLNPVEEIVEVARSVRPELKVCVDAMSSFGVYDIDMAKGVDFVCSGMNKGIEGIPGCTFVLCEKAALLASEGSARCFTMDLHLQWRNFEKSGEFRFTPPTQTILAFDQALHEWDAEGGAAGRRARYTENYEIILGAMTDLGFRTYVEDPGERGCIITTYVCPESLAPAWDFRTFYQKLADRGFLIYPATVGGAQAFRIGNIGQLFPQDARDLAAAIRAIVAEM